MKCFFLLFMSLFLSFEVSASKLLYDERTIHIASRLKCLVCHGQSVADSDSDFARNIKMDIAKGLKQNMNEMEILDQMAAQYGDVILFSPPNPSSHLALWFFPILLLLFLLIFLKRHLWIKS